MNIAKYIISDNALTFDGGNTLKFDYRIKSVKSLKVESVLVIVLESAHGTIDNRNVYDLNMVSQII
jgi:hypothetical protein